MTDHLQGKIVLITGAAKGQGAAEAALFVKRGAEVFLADVAHEAGHALAAALGDRAHYVPLDISQEESWVEAMASIDARCGKLDILINNAGVFSLSSIERTSAQEYMRLVHVNQLGTFLGMKAAIPLMKKAGGGSIVNISSLHGLTGSSQTIAYVSTKWAIRGMTKAAALELAPFNIRVNSVHPGAIKTDLALNVAAPDPDVPYHMPLIPQDRWAEASEVAEMVAFVASDACSYSTGSEFVCDGGIMAF